jgi:hypothetical protein
MWLGAEEGCRIDHHGDRTEISIEPEAAGAALVASASAMFIGLNGFPVNESVQ